MKDAELVKAIKLAIVELEQMHSYIATFRQSPCPDQGSHTCPTWEAIHALRAQLAKYS